MTNEPKKRFSVSIEDDINDLIDRPHTVAGLLSLVTEHSGAWSAIRQGVITARVQADVAAPLKAGVDDLIRVHAETGIDLAAWEPLLPMIRLVYPDFDPIPEELRVLTAASDSYHRQRYGTERDSDIPIGRDTFRGAEDWRLSQ